MDGWCKDPGGKKPKELKQESTPVPFFRNKSLGLDPGFRREEPAKSTTYETSNSADICLSVLLFVIYVC
jgi:hypothetical protein